MSRVCSLVGCDGPHYGRGYCQKHYRRWYERGGTPAEVAVNRNMNPTTIVRTRVYKHGRLIEESERPANIKSGNAVWRDL